MRACGILMPISSLPSEYGIGCFDECAYKFVDDLVKAGQQYWQILPLGHTSYGDSPYQSFSTFAGNPYFVSIKELIKEGYITKKECAKYDLGDNSEYIDYEKMYNGRYEIYRIAFKNSNITSDPDFKKFVKDQEAWLADYALFMAVKSSYDGKSFIEWDDDIKFRKPEAMAKYLKKYKDEVDFYCFIQYEFYKQWYALKEYANKKGVKIIGDIPIYVAYDSADVWKNPELFLLDDKLVPIKVAGCPPDAFSDDGQLWGNPLYTWDYHKKTGYTWWKERIGTCSALYDMVRIDHFRGFDEYYTIPFGHKNARVGAWVKGPGYDLFDALNKEFGDMNIIAEDLGFLTDSVRDLLKKTGYPGMKILQFAFGETNVDSEYLPHNYPTNCLVYTGTHDNDSIKGWLATQSEKDRKGIIAYLGLDCDVEEPLEAVEDIHWKFITSCMTSVADYCIIPIQDILGLSSEARINIPSTVGNNWKWRIREGAFSDEIIEKLDYLACISGRK
ncbi:MAG: 4-alpha-glucanotransferase [Clostridiales bacterium]|nr:4-alpha-glucanotransferase [Clostridiales bacterium]